MFIKKKFLNPTSFLFFYFIINKLQKEKILALEPISINLLTSVHPNLKWNFKPNCINKDIE